MINVIQQPNDFQTDSNIWWLIYDSTNLNIVFGPIQSSGKTGSPLTIVTTYLREELDQYITDNNLIYATFNPEQQTLE